MLNLDTVCDGLPVDRLERSREVVQRLRVLHAEIKAVARRHRRMNERFEWSAGLVIVSPCARSRAAAFRRRCVARGRAMVERMREMVVVAQRLNDMAG